MTDVSAQFFSSFCPFLFYDGKRAAAPPLFYNAKCYCHDKRLFLCQEDVAEMLMFSINGCATMAANESIADPLFCFFFKCFFSPNKRDRSALT